MPTPTPLAGRRRPIVCLVTDRRRWGAAWLEGRWQEPMLARLAAAAQGGVDIVQIREPDLDARQLSNFVDACVATLRSTDTLVVVNERADVALAARAHGVHLRAASYPAARLRRIVPAGFVIGRSVHGVEDVLAGADAQADYLVAGTVFPSRSKPQGHALLGLSGLAAIARASDCPVLAIGGLSVPHAQAVARAGASGVAGIDLFEEATRSAEACARLVDGLRRAFDLGRDRP